MMEVGIDLRRHRSRQIAADDLLGSDLVITMTRQHAMDLVLLDPRSWPRTFPIVDLVRRAQAIGRIGVGETLGHWVARVHGRRQHSELLALRSSDDVDDPVGQPLAMFRRTRDILSGLVEELAGLITAGPDRGWAG